MVHFDRWILWWYTFTDGFSRPRYTLTGGFRNILSVLQVGLAVHFDRQGGLNLPVQNTPECG